MGFTKNALFPNTQKQKGKKKFQFWKINSKSVFPSSKPQPKQMGFFQQNNSQPIFLSSFDIKIVEFQEFANPNKTVEIEKNAWN